MHIPADPAGKIRSAFGFRRAPSTKGKVMTDPVVTRVLLIVLMEQTRRR
jgi:hypothetical protein